MVLEYCKLRQNCFYTKCLVNQIVTFVSVYIFQCILVQNDPKAQFTMKFVKTDDLTITAESDQKCLPNIGNKDTMIVNSHPSLFILELRSLEQQHQTTHTLIFCVAKYDYHSNSDISFTLQNTKHTSINTNIFLNLRKILILRNIVFASINTNIFLNLRKF